MVLLWGMLTSFGVNYINSILVWGSNIELTSIQRKTALDKLLPLIVIYNIKYVSKTECPDMIKIDLKMATLSTCNVSIVMDRFN